MSKRKLHYEPIEIEVSAEEFEQAKQARLGAAVRSNPVSARERSAQRKRQQAEFRRMQIDVYISRPRGWKRGPVIHGPDDMTAFIGMLSAALDSDVQESFYAIPLNTAHEPVGIYEVARGSLADVEVAPADAIRAVLAAGAAKFIIVHNHPSGHAQPSNDDAVLTGRFKTAAKCVGVQLLDHIIIGAEGEFFSFSAAGVIE